MTTGNVFLADALQTLCFGPKSYFDPVDSSPFNPDTDVLTLNKPADPAWRDIKRWKEELGSSGGAIQSVGNTGGIVQAKPEASSSGASSSSSSSSSTVGSHGRQAGGQLGASSFAVKRDATNWRGLKF